MEHEKYDRSAACDLGPKVAGVLAESAARTPHIPTIVDGLRSIAQHLGLMPSSVLYTAADILSKWSLSDETAGLRENLRRTREELARVRQKCDQQWLLIDAQAKKQVELEQRMKSAVVALESRNV